MNSQLAIQRGTPMIRILMALALGSVLAVSPTLASAADAPDTLHYWHLYSDAQGVSHFKQEEIAFKAAPVPGLAKPPIAANLDGANGATFLLLHPSQVEDWHKAPKKQFLIVVQGASQVTAGDGTIKEFHVGDIILMDDTTGKGHITKGLGTTDHIALVIPVTP
jgi:quercetin dioxygenase-like cupin family protein